MIRDRGFAPVNLSKLRGEPLAEMATRAGGVILWMLDRAREIGKRPHEVAIFIFDPDEIREAEGPGAAAVRQRFLGEDGAAATSGWPVGSLVAREHLRAVFAADPNVTLAERTRLGEAAAAAVPDGFVRVCAYRDARWLIGAVPVDPVLWREWGEA